ncbi:hypothetical protein Pmani_031764 [Petrolisthes manimaculis]|uniref:Uncharacterized protein n=1 Tax=Petrolisthes manimaculis TaxID=1843537 RepID=A0AAE1NUH8_9EUCA|nr:hypothetical protein Pmani_031764 [Petrolisthes manimaculis]
MDNCAISNVLAQNIYKHLFFLRSSTQKTRKSHDIFNEGFASPVEPELELYPDSYLGDYPAHPSLGRSPGGSGSVSPPRFPPGAPRDAPSPQYNDHGGYTRQSRGRSRSPPSSHHYHNTTSSPQHTRAAGGSPPSPGSTHRRQRNSGAPRNSRVKRFLLTRDPKDRRLSGNGLGMKVVGGKEIPGTRGNLGAYIARIQPGGVAECLGQLKEGDLLLEWNGISLMGRTYEEVQRILLHSADDAEVEIVVRSDIDKITGERLTTREAADNNDYHHHDDHHHHQHQHHPRANDSPSNDPLDINGNRSPFDDHPPPTSQENYFGNDNRNSRSRGGGGGGGGEPLDEDYDSRPRSRSSSRPPHSHHQLSPDHRRRDSYDGTRPQQDPMRPRNSEQRPRDHSQEPPSRSHHGSPETRHRGMSQDQPDSRRGSGGTQYSPEGVEGPRRHSHDSPPDTRPPRHPTHTHHHQDHTEARPPRPHTSPGGDNGRTREHRRHHENDQYSPVSSGGGGGGVEGGAPDQQHTNTTRRRGRSHPKHGAAAATRGNNSDQQQQHQMGEVQLQVCYDYKAAILYVTVIRARGLYTVRDDGETRPDPFVKVYLLPGRSVENQRRTRYFTQTSSPDWNQTMVYPSLQELSKRHLEVTAWNYHTDKDKPNEFLGEVVLDLSDKNVIDEEPRWYQLQELDREDMSAQLPGGFGFL